LRGAGDLGLTIEDLLDVIGAVDQKQLVKTRLDDLQNRNEVTFKNNTWKILIKDGTYNLKGQFLVRINNFYADKIRKEIILLKSIFNSYNLAD